MKQPILTDDDYAQTIPVPPEGIRHGSGPSFIAGPVDWMASDKRIAGLLIPSACIKNRIEHLARQISSDWGDAESIDLICVLKGAVIFASDLAREIYIRSGKSVRFHMIKTSVYEKSIKKTNEEYRAVRLDLEPKDIEGKDILLVEDIADQGFTLNWLFNYLLNERKVKSLKTCTLMYKLLDNPSLHIKKLRESIKIDYVGFTIPDLWIAGYGVDAGEEIRNLPDIVHVNQKFFK